MNIKSLHIETIFSGGVHLLWITLLVLFLLGESPEKIFCYLSNLESGTGVVLVAILFSLSFFLGRVAEHILIAFNYYCRKGRIGKIKMIIFFEGDRSVVWGNKIFSINSFVGLVLLVIVMLTLSVIYKSLNIIWPIILIGIPIILATWISYCYWQDLDEQLNTYRIKRIRQDNSKNKIINSNIDVNN